MQLFKKRESLTQNIAYMAIMAAINVIFVLLGAIIPALMFVLIFVLPLISAVVALLCKKTLYPIYAIVTIALCGLAASSFSILDTFFYVVPSVITGFLFGLLVEKNVHGIYIFGVLSFTQFLITYLTLLTVQAIIPELNYVNRFLDIFGLTNSSNYMAIYLTIVVILSEIQIFFTIFIMKLNLNKIGFKINLSKDIELLQFLINIGLLILALFGAIFYPPIAFIFILFSLPFAMYQLVILLLYKKIWIYIALGVSLVASVLIFAGCYLLLPHPVGIILVTPLLALISMIYFVNYLYIKKTSSDKINS